jgi:predicted nucleic acid-binding protein
VTAGGFRYDLARKGVILTITDCLIAAVAIDSGSTLVTRNTKDYPMPGITLLTP